MNINSLDQAVHLYHCDPSLFAGSEDALCRQLSADELARADGFRFEHDRLQYLVAHAMLRCALSRYGDTEPSDWRFSANEHGKPAIVDGNAVLDFNLSHTEGLCVVMVTRGLRCGVDVERLSRASNIEGVARKMFAPQEVDYILSDASHMQRRFVMLWSLRESYLKALGTGVSGNSKSFGFQLEDDLAVRLVFDDGSAHAWHLMLEMLDDRHVLAMCVEGGAGREIVRQDMGPLWPELLSE